MDRQRANKLYTIEKTIERSIKWTEVLQFYTFVKTVAIEALNDVKNN